MSVDVKVESVIVKVVSVVVKAESVDVKAHSVALKAESESDGLLNALYPRLSDESLRPLH